MSIEVVDSARKRCSASQSLRFERAFWGVPRGVVVTAAIDLSRHIRQPESVAIGHVCPLRPCHISLFRNVSVQEDVAGEPTAARVGIEIIIGGQNARMEKIAGIDDEAIEA